MNSLRLEFDEGDVIGGFGDDDIYEDSQYEDANYLQYELNELGMTQKARDG